MTTPTDPQTLIQKARDLCKAATPGPLSRGRYFDVHEFCNITDSRDLVVARVFGSGDNGLLFAAAPTLLLELAEALEEMTGEWERTEQSAISYRQSMVLARKSATSYRESMLRAEQELADHKAKMVGLLADAYAKGRAFNEDVDDRGSEDG